MTSAISQRPLWLSR